MTNAEVDAAFAGIDPKHPFYLAVLQVLDDAVINEQDAATIPDLTDGARHFNAGRLAHAKDVRAFMEDMMANACVRAEIERQKFEAAQRRRENQPDG